MFQWGAATFAVAPLHLFGGRPTMDRGSRKGTQKEGPDAEAAGVFKAPAEEGAQAQRAMAALPIEAK